MEKMIWFLINFDFLPFYTQFELSALFGINWGVLSQTACWNVLDVYHYPDETKRLPQ